MIRWLVRYRRWAGALLGASALSYMTWQLWLARDTLSLAPRDWSWRAPLAVLAYICGHLCCGGALRWTCRATGTDVSLTEAVRTYVFSQPLKYFPAGSAINLASQSYSLGMLRGAGLIRSSLGIGLHVLITMLSALVIYLASRFTGGLSRVPVPDWLALSGTLLLIGVLLPGVWERLVRALPWAASRLRRRPAASPPAVLPRLRYRSVAAAFAAVSLAWAAYGAGFVTLASAYGKAGCGHVVELGAAQACAWAVGYLLVIFPAGLGVREGTLAYLLASFCPVGVALSLPLASRAAWVVGDGLNFLVAWLLRGPRGDPPRTQDGDSPNSRSTTIQGGGSLTARTRP